MKTLRYASTLIACLLVLAATAMPALAQSSDWSARAVERAEGLQRGAEATLGRANARVLAAESDSAAAKSALSAASGNKQALAVAHEADSVAQEGLQLARKLQASARAFLVERQRAVRMLRAQLEGRGGSTRGLLLTERGEVRRSAADGSALAPESPLGAGQRVETAAGAQASLYVAQGQGEVSLSESSSLSVRKDDEDGFLADLDKGYARFLARLRAKLQKRFEVRTPAAVLGVRGTEYSVRSQPEATEVQVHSGVVAVTPSAGGETVEVQAGSMLTVGRDGRVVGPVPLPGPAPAPQGVK